MHTTQAPTVPHDQLIVQTGSAAPQTDPWTIKAVVLILGLLALTALGGTIALIWAGKDAASVAVVSGLAGTAFGALASLLASTRSASPLPGSRG